MNIVKALQIQALANAMLDEKSRPRDYQLRAIMRWYSKTFSTALHKVYELPVVDIIQTYFEEVFEDMDIEQLEAKRVLLLETDADRAAREQAEINELANDLAYYEEIRKEEEDRLAKLPEAQRKALLSETKGSDKETTIVEAMGGSKIRIVADDGQEYEAQAITEQAPVIDMTFDGLDGMDDLDAFGSVPHPNRNR